MGVQERATNGLKLLMNQELPFSQAQAAWRFYNNESVDIAALTNPLFETLTEEIKNQCDRFVLAMSDWSHIDYKKHKSKRELNSKNKKGGSAQIGYDLQSTLAVSDRTGEPISAMVHNLKTEEKIYSTYDEKIGMNLTHLDELGLRAQWIQGNFETDKEIVHIVDREADSVAFMRQLALSNILFLLRVKTSSGVYDLENKREIKQIDLANSLSLGEKVKSIIYEKKRVNIYVNSCAIEVRRDAKRYIVNEDGKQKLQTTPGAAVKARFIVERLVDENNKVVAEWLLITNILDTSVTPEILGTWYYYRWKIESYFKLLKSSGFNMENWQQREPIALFRRLLVVSYASVLVWKIANDSSANAKKMRDFLIQLSGKLIERGKEFTYPALLSGLWVYLQMMDVMQSFSIEELFDMKNELSDLIGFQI